MFIPNVNHLGMNIYFLINIILLKSKVITLTKIS